MPELRGLVERVHGSGTFVSEPRLLLERRLAFDDRGRPVDFGTGLYRGDGVRFVTDAATVAVPIGEEVASEPTRR